MPSRPRKKTRGSFNPLKFVLITCGALLVLLVVGLLSAKSMLNGWLRGEGFRDWLAQRAAQVLRSEITLGELEWQGSEVYTKRFAALGREDAGFAELNLDGVRARPGGIADRAVRVAEVTVNRLDLRFSPKHPGGAAPPGEAPAGALVARPAPALPAWLANYLPDRVEIDEIAVASVRVEVERQAGAVFLLQGTKAVFEPDFRTGFWAIEGTGGKVVLPGQPEFAMKDLGLRWKGDRLFIDRCVFGVHKAGRIEGKGEIGFAGEGSFDLDLQISGIDVDEMVTGEWRDRLAGTLHGPVRISGPPGALVYEGTLNVAEGVVSSLPVLKLIAQYTRSDRFERFVLNQAKTDFKREGERLELRQLVLQSDGLARIEGQMDLVGTQLAGELRVGVTPGTMRWIPGAERLVFTEDREGFLWAPMKLTGTTTEPKEDLSARLVAAAGEAILTDLPADVLDAAKGLLKPGGEAPGTEKAAPEDLIDQGKKMIDLLTPFLKAP